MNIWGVTILERRVYKNFLVQTVQSLFTADEFVCLCAFAPSTTHPLNAFPALNSSFGLDKSLPTNYIMAAASKDITHGAERHIITPVCHTLLVFPVKSSSHKTGGCGACGSCTADSTSVFFFLWNWCCHSWGIWVRVRMQVIYPKTAKSWLQCVQYPFGFSHPVWK